jgi:sugar phosphate isomerase/epimerase
VTVPLSITTDYATDRGNPEPYLRRIAEAGFTHVHWCHQWCTDFVYSRPEIDQIKRWFAEFGLALNDLHGTGGVEKNWGSPTEWARLAGIELVTNRMEMVAELGGDVLIMHPYGLHDGDTDEQYRDRLSRTFDALRPVSRQTGVRIALENLFSLPDVADMISPFEPEFVGLCYDSGHGNLQPGEEALDQLEASGLLDRLLAVHLHDNDGRGDSHHPMFTGTVNWERLAHLIAHSSYTKPISMECTMPDPDMDEMDFLRNALADGQRLDAMVASHRASQD